MSLDLDKLTKNLEKALDSMTQEDWDEFNAKIDEGKEDVPMGWISIDDFLPAWMGEDVWKGYSTYKVKYEDGTEDESFVTDHTTWYYRVKDDGITHWYNDGRIKRGYPNNR